MYLLFGGGGFIGRHVCDILERDRIPFSIVTLRPDVNLRRQYSQIQQIVRASELDQTLLRDLLDQASSVIYMAGHSKPSSFQASPWLAVRDEVEPVFTTIATIAELAPEKNVVFISSAGSIYGDSPERHDENSPTLPISAYGLSKLQIENALGFLQRTRGLDCKILRVTNPVGRHQSVENHGLVSVCLRRALEKKPIAIYGSLETRRDYLDGDDLAEAIVRVAAASDKPGGVWNVGQGRSHSIREVLETIETTLGEPLEIVHQDRRGYDVEVVEVSIDKFMADYRWAPSRDLKTIVTNLRDYLVSANSKPMPQ